MSFDSISTFGNIFGIQNTNSVQAVSGQRSSNTSISAPRTYGHDTVSISGEAMEKYLAMKNAGKEGKGTDVASQVSAWYDNFRENMGMVDEPDYATWPPENLARRQKLIEERDALAPHCSNTNFTESNKKMNGILDSLMALDAVGGRKVLSDKDMVTAVGALHTAMDNTEGDIPGTSAYLAGMGDAPAGAALTADGGIMRPASGSASSLKEMYFLNRFPEIEEEELLLDDEESSEDEEGNKTAASPNMAGSQVVQERGAEQVALYKLADYLIDAPINSSIVERADVPSATKVWLDDIK